MTESTYIRDYLHFLGTAPTPTHAAVGVTKRLDQAGFTAVDETGAWPSEPGAYYLRRQGAVVAWVVPPSATADNIKGFNIFGSHTDSPALKLKPTPQHTTADGWGQLDVEIYGAPILNSWLDRELSLAGVVYDHDGNEHLLFSEPVARIPQLAIHLDRDVNKGLTLDPQQNLQPVWTVDDPDAQIMDLVALAAHLPNPDHIASYDVILTPTQEPDMFGGLQDFIAAGRQDNLSSVFAGLFGILAAAQQPADGRISVMAAFDHEEVGSQTATGAAGPLLTDVLERTGRALGCDAERRAQILAGSTCVSADAGHSVHPNYPNVSDPQTRPVLGRGPLTKINANQRYATDAQGIALWNRVCAAAGVTTQPFVSNNDIPCGSTIGPIMATRLGITTVDVGIPLLSMHSAREMSHRDDCLNLAKAASTYLRADF